MSSMDMWSLLPQRHLYMYDIPPSPPASPAPPPYSPLPAPATADPEDILAILRAVDAAATLVCNEVDNALEPEHVDHQALKNLRKAVENLKSDIMLYNVLLEKDTKLDFIQLLEGVEALTTALVATRLVLEENPAAIRYEDTTNTFRSEKPKSVLNFALNVLMENFRPGSLVDLIGDLKDATDEILMCKQNNEHAFKLVWYNYVINQQWTGRFPIDIIDNSQDRVWHALDLVLDAFRVHPFAVSPGSIPPIDVNVFAILNHNHEAATRHEKFARRIGKAWVDDRIPKYYVRVRELGALQASLFELLWSGTVEHLKRHSPYSSDDPKQPKFERAVGELERMLQEIILRSKKEHFSIAFCGMVDAGKSLFLNALIGLAILPSDELLPTAWPCRLRHVEGQSDPELRFEAEPFIVALKKLQAHQYGQKMQTYQPPSDNMFGTLFSDGPSELSEEEALLRTIHSQWVNLHPATRENLLMFETPGFELPLLAIGDRYVKLLLGQLNDIVRLCQRFDLKFDMSEVHWPLLTVEFKSLRGVQMDGIYEFIDLPDICKDFRGFNFESLVRLVASNSNAIAPIVPFKEFPRSDWKRLPALVASGFNGRANVVVCTHLDPVSQENMDEQLKNVTEAFWPRGVLNTNCIIPCSLLGLSARYLLDKSDRTKPPFEAIWNKHTVGYHCAAKILGVEDPQATYDQFDIQTWRDKLQAELRASGLSGDIQRLAKKMIDSARVNALLSEADTVIRQLREIRLVYEQTLVIEATRIEAELDAANRKCNEAPKVSKGVLETLGRVESMQTEEVRLLLEKKSGIISETACGLINQTVTKTLTDIGMSLEDMDAGSSTRSVSSSMRGIMQFGSVQLGNKDISGKLQRYSSVETANSNVLVTETRTRAKDFLQLCQRELNLALETLKEEYTAIILDLGGTQNAKLLRVVRGMVKEAELPPLPQDWEYQIGDPVPPPLNVDGLAFQEWEIRGVINSRQVTLFSRQYIIEMDTLHDRIKNDIVDAWIGELKEEGEAALFGTIGKCFTDGKDWITSALLEKELRCKQELEKKERLDGEERVERLTAMYSNILAAEEALGELLARVGALQI